MKHVVIMDFSTPIPVSVFIELTNKQLSQLQAKIVGEVSGLKKAASGHVYFDIKDHEGTLSCAMWKFKYQLSGIPLEEGMQIVITGTPNVYAPSGRFSFIVDTAEYAGEGALKQAYDRLRIMLESEGLFRDERKQKLPSYIQRVGVITSRQGAVIHDFTNNLGPWGFKLTFIDARVEGKEAILDLINAMKTMAKQDIEALVIMRGGGSRASLSAFDSEMLVREIAAFPVPVIAGIGHHEDVPLAVLASDIAVSTPTAAAHALNETWEQAAYLLDRYHQTIVRSYDQSLQVLRQYTDTYPRGIFKTFYRLHIATVKSITASWDQIITVRQRLALRSMAERLDHVASLVNLHDPARLLALGYSIVRHNGRIVTSNKHVTIGDTLSIQTGDGLIESKVTKHS